MISFKDILREIWHFLKWAINFIFNTLIYVLLTTVLLMAFGLFSSEPFMIVSGNHYFWDKYLLYLFTFYAPFMVSYWILSMSLPNRSFKISALGFYCCFTIYLASNGKYWMRGMEIEPWFVYLIFLFVPVTVIMLIELIKFYQGLIKELSERSSE